MLPFLEPKKVAGGIISQRGKPDLAVNPETPAPDSDVDPAMQSIGEDILRAVNDKSPIGIAKALQASWDIYMNQPEESEAPMEGEQ